ncbi:unnamed protein product [Nezara viridula]|uniref:Uncharacterized protein n=1 Tax=Nezara viridula TaxID=85310 RepID=A0A9P0E9A3_NEZVI|nr:unnamed protein product [Nezara viridula]
MSRAEFYEVWSWFDPCGPQLTKFWWLTLGRPWRLSSILMATAHESSSTRSLCRVPKQREVSVFYAESSLFKT